MRPGVAHAVSQVQKDALILELAPNSAALIQQATTLKNNTRNFFSGIYVSEQGTAQQAE